MRSEEEKADAAQAEFDERRQQWEENQAAYEAQQALVEAGKLIPGTIPTYADPGIQAEYETGVVPAYERPVYYTKPPDPYSIEDIQEFREYGGGLLYTEDGVVGPVQAIDEFEAEVEGWGMSEQEQFRQETIQQQRQDAYERRRREDYLRLSPSFPHPIDPDKPLTTHIGLIEALDEVEFNPQSRIAQDMGETALTDPAYLDWFESKMDYIESKPDPLSPSDRQEYREFGEADAGFISYLDSPETSDEYGLLGGTMRPSLTWAGNPLEWAKEQQDPADWPLEKYFQPKISDDFYMDKSFTEYGTWLDYESDIGGEGITRYPSRIDDFDPKYVSGEEQPPEYLSNYQRMMAWQKAGKRKVGDPLKEWKVSAQQKFNEDFGLQEKEILDEFGEATTYQYFELAPLFDVGGRLAIGPLGNLLIDKLPPVFWPKEGERKKFIPDSVPAPVELSYIEKPIELGFKIGTRAIEAGVGMIAGGPWSIGATLYTPPFQERDFTDITYTEDLYWKK